MTISTLVSFPSGLKAKSEKDDPAYGKKVAAAVLSSSSQQRAAFKKMLFENRKYAEGNQSVAEYLDELEIDGENMYTNISYRPRPIAQKFKEAVVGGYLMKNEYPSVIALSKHIKDAKEKKKSDAEFRMEYGEVLNALSQEAGIPLEDPKEFTPKTKEESDIYFSLNDKEKEELLMQEMVSFALKDNDIESLKNNVLDDQYVAQFHGYYNYIDDNGRLIIDYIQAEDIVVDNSRFEDFRDANYKGRFVRMMVSEARARFAIKPQDEQALFMCAKNAAGKFGNANSFTWEWTPDYRNSGVDRPYDSQVVELLHFWWRTSKVLNYVEGKDRYGREVFDVDYSIPNKTIKSEGRKKVGQKYPQTAYEGWFSADASICLEWGEQKNILRKGEDKDELLCNFIFFMPRNKGRMLPRSLQNMIIDNIRNMDIAVLKIKQLIAKATPDDYIIDIDALNELDLGTGELLQPLDIMQIHAQTGRLYYRGKKEDGLDNAPPIRPNLNPISDKMQSYINWYNTELNNIRDYLGVNEFRDGSATAPRTGFRFMQAQAEASNTATWFIYRAYVKSTEELVKQIGIRIWDSFNYGTPNKGYLKYLGKENIEWVKSRKEITASSYDISYSLAISDEDKAILEQYINTCLGNGTLTMGDALMLRRVQDPLIAEKLLAYTEKKRREENLEEQRVNQEAAANYTAQAGVAVEQAKQQTAQIQIQFEQAKEEAKNTGAQTLALLNGAIELIKASVQTGTPIPPEYMSIVSMATNNALLKTQMSASQTEQAMQQQQLQQQEQELAQAVESGEISEEEAMQMVGM